MTSCIETTGPRTPAGYGRASIAVGPLAYYFVYAHRVAWEQANGQPIPPGMVVRHACDNPPCVNPLHLQLGTHADNVRDTHERGRRQYVRKTHCIRGHEFAEENVYFHGGSRHCRKCKAELKVTQDKGSCGGRAMACCPKCNECYVFEPGVFR